jgi:hypothetical protein
MKLRLLGIATAAALLAMASASFAQSTQEGTSAGGSASGTVTIPDTGVPSIGGSGSASGSALGGLSKCENLLGGEKEKCLQEERARTRSTGGRPAGAGGSHAPGSTGTGSGTSGAQGTAPSGSVR